MLAVVMDAFSQVRLVIDAKEQRVERPRGEARRKPFYSGKKRCHTLKTQVAVLPDSRLGAVSESVPGGSWHDLTLLRHSGLLDRLDPESDEGAMLDEGYIGAGRGHPELPLSLPHRAWSGRPLTEGQKADNRLLSRYRIVVEHTLAQMGRYQVLRQLWRSDVGRQGRAI